MKLHGHDIEAGDKVWDIKYGDCELLGFDNSDLPYLVKVEDNLHSWACRKELFWQPFDIPSHAYQKPKKLVERGIVVFKRDNGFFDCSICKVTKKYFEKNMSYTTFIRFVEETVEMVEE